MDDELEDREDQLEASYEVAGMVTFLNWSSKPKTCIIDDQKREYLCEIPDRLFLQEDDLISFKTTNVRTGTRGNQKGKRVYIMPNDITKIEIVMSDADNIVCRCFKRADGAKAEKNFIIASNLAQEEVPPVSVAEYLYATCELQTRDPATHIFSWWLKNRVYRRLWNLGLKTKDNKDNKSIEEYTEALQCSVAQLYDKLVKLPGPLHTVCIDLKLSIQLSHKFNIPYSKRDVSLARVARFIYQCSSKLHHCGIGQKQLRRQFPKLDELKDELLVRYPIVAIENNTGGCYYYLHHNYRVLDFLSTTIANMLKMQRDFPGEKIIPNFAKDKIIDETQKLAVTGALNNRVFGIFGGPGTGKTTITRYIVKNLAERGVQFLLCGPTGPSVVVMRDNLLGLGFDEVIRQRTMTLKMLVKKAGAYVIDQLIIDEISMVDHTLLYEVMVTYPGIRYLTVIGDNNQLQPLKWGNTMQQLIDCQLVPYVKLKKNYRTKNSIIKLGKNSELMETEHCRIIEGGVDDTIALYEDLLNQGVKHRDIMVISPTNNEVDTLNIGIQSLIAGRRESGTDTRLEDKRGRNFIEGDKVILLKNNYEIKQMNGDLGIIIIVDRRKRTMTVEFKNKAEVYQLSNSQYGGDYAYHGDGDMMSTDALSLAHSITVHKAQGKQARVIIVHVDHGPKNKEFFNFHMLWTAISRTEEDCYLVGDTAAIRRYFNKFPEKKIDHLAAMIIEKYEED